MTGLLDRDAAWCRKHLGKRIGDIPLRPDDNRCDLCQRVVKARLDCDYGPGPLRSGLSIERCFRGWCCTRCRSLLRWIDSIGKKTLYDYYHRPFPIGTLRPPPRDGLCELCRKAPCRKLHRDHDHQLVEDFGFKLSDSQRGYPCESCNSNKLAWVDRIGFERVDKYLKRAPDELPTSL